MFLNRRRFSLLEEDRDFSWCGGESPALSTLKPNHLKSFAELQLPTRVGSCLSPKHRAAHTKTRQIGLGKGHVTNFHEISDLERRLGAKLQLLGNSDYVVLYCFPPSSQSNVIQDCDQFFHLWQYFWLILLFALGR